MPYTELLRHAVDVALREGASYAEARYHKRVELEIPVRNGRVVAVGSRDSEGIAVRVVWRGSVAFSSTPKLTKEAVEEAVRRALAQARASSGRAVEVELPEQRLGRASYEVKPLKPFDSASLEDKVGLLKEVWSRCRDTVKRAKLEGLTVLYEEMLEEKEVVTSDGGWVESRTPRLYVYALATVYDAQKGSMQRSVELGATGGLEWLREWRLEDLLPDEVSRVERVLLEGVEPPKEPVPVVLGSEVVGLIVHESAGHPMEADRIWGREAAQAGESFVKSEMLGRERIGNELATVVDDPTVPGSFGFYLYDDEAVPARPRYIYREGMVWEPLHSRWTAALFGVESNAAARAKDYESEPIVRMATTYLTPGDARLEELLEMARGGVYIRSFMEWNIDDVRWGQRYVGLEAYEVSRGEPGRPVKYPVLEVTTRAFYSSIEAKSRELKFYAGMCGKGEPMQGIPVWFGGPDVLLKPLKLGVRTTG